MKLTPIWMFILLLAILIISVLMGAPVSEGFTLRTAYVETDVGGYANKVWPLVTSTIHFDKANGNVVMQTGTTVDKILTRTGDETGAASSVVKLETPLATTMASAYSSWTTDRTVSGTKQQIFYMPWDKTTFVHLVTDSVHTSGFCFHDSIKYVGDYNESEPGKTQARGYTSLVTVENDRLETNTMFLKQLYGIKSAGIFYDVSSGCVVIPKSTDSFDVLDRDGKDVTMSGLKIVTEGSTKDKFDFSLGADSKYTLKTGKAFEPWILNIAIGAAAKTAEDAVAAAKAVVVTKTAENTATTANTSTASALVAAQATLDEKKSALAALATKSIVIMPYGVKTLIATFVKETSVVKLTDVKRFDASGLIVTPPIITTPDTTTPDTTTPGVTPPSADSAISEYYKWYWYWNKTGKTMTDDYMLKTQIVPPVCPSCPSVTCASASAGTGTGTGAGTGTVGGIGGGQPISDAVKTVGSVAEKAIGTTGDIVNSFGSASREVSLGTVDLAKGTVSGTIGLAKDVVGGTVGLARDTVGGTADFVKDAARGTVGVAKDALGGAVDLTKDTLKGTVNLARGKYGSNSNSSDASYSWAGRNQTSGYNYDYDDDDGKSGPMDPYTYNGALKKRSTSTFMPVTANFSAFSK